MAVNEVEWYAVDWIRLAHSTVKCRAVVNTVMNFRCP